MDDDIFLWPDGFWCFRVEGDEFLDHRSDDYLIVDNNITVGDIKAMFGKNIAEAFIEEYAEMYEDII